MLKESTLVEIMDGLKKRGVSATYEYPGYIDMHPPTGVVLRLNDCAGSEPLVIEVHALPEDGSQPQETIESMIPGDSQDVDRIVDWLTITFSEACGKATERDDQEQHDALAELSTLYESWTKRNNMPKHDAEELLCREDLSDYQRNWLKVFCSLWEVANA